MYEEVNLKSIDLSTNTSASDISPNTLATNADSDPCQITWLSHNSLLNCLFILTNRNQLILYDCNSKNILKKINLDETTTGKGNPAPTHTHTHLSIDLNEC